MTRRLAHSTYGLDPATSTLAHSDLVTSYRASLLPREPARLHPCFVALPDPLTQLYSPVQLLAFTALLPLHFPHHLGPSSLGNPSALARKVIMDRRLSPHQNGILAPGGPQYLEYEEESDGVWHEQDV